MGASEYFQDVGYCFVRYSEPLLSSSLSSPPSTSKRSPPLTSSLNRLTLHDPIQLQCQGIVFKWAPHSVEPVFKRGRRAPTSHKLKQRKLASAYSTPSPPLPTDQLSPLATGASFDQCPQVGAGKGKYKPLLLQRGSHLLLSSAYATLFTASSYQRQRRLFSQHILQVATATVWRI